MSVRQSRGANVAVVTGGGGGIGRETAIRLQGTHSLVAVLDQNIAAARETVAKITEIGGHAAAIQVDVASPSSVQRAFSSLGRPQIQTLVNCAGIREIRKFTELSIDEWKHVIDVNLNGCFYVISEAYELLIKPGASIVNVASVAGLVGVPERIAYSASKHGVVGLTKSLSSDLGHEGIRVNVVCPGVTETPMTQAYFSDPAVVSDVIKAHPLARWGQPAEIASVIAMMCSDDASFCTGAVIAVDGGYTAVKGF